MWAPQCERTNCNNRENHAGSSMRSPLKKLASDSQKRPRFLCVENLKTTSDPRSWTVRLSGKEDSRKQTLLRRHWLAGKEIITSFNYALWANNKSERKWSEVISNQIRRTHVYHRWVVLHCGPVNCRSTYMLEERVSRPLGCRTGRHGARRGYKEYSLPWE